MQLPTRYGLPSFWILLEMKTVGAKYFKDLKNLGVYKAREKYYKQMCVYGYKFTLMDTFGPINYALFYGVCKDNDEVDIEMLPIDHALGKETIDKAEAIAKQYYPPAKLSKDASYWECKICPMWKVCHDNQKPAVNCRSCKFAQPVSDGQWMCHHHNAIIPKEFLIKGCQAWESLPL